MRYELLVGHMSDTPRGRVQVHVRVVWRERSGASLSDMNP